MALDTKQRNRPRFPWWPLIVLLVAIYVFWVLPYQRGDQDVRVEFEEPGQSE